MEHPLKSEKASQFPKDYKALLNLHDTEKAIKAAKDIFEKELAGSLKLSRVTSPLFVQAGSGINDDLNGIERPVSFPVKNMGERKMEIVQSLAKWKRMALCDLGFKPGYGLYTDMNAIRPDDDIDCIHSIYVDQWDWEKVMLPEERNLSFLKKTVSTIYDVIKRTAFRLCEFYPVLSDDLPDDITFVHSEDLALEYPNLSPDEREYEVAKRYGAVFVIGIGYGNPPHGGRAPDYDDWSTVVNENSRSYHGLNGDIIVWDSVRGRNLELSSMGIRVDKDALVRQLALKGLDERRDLYWHSRLLNGDFPQTIGGGIGQSRLCMFLLKKAHIGEVQASVWPKEVYEEAKAHGAHLF